jgi:hypothetical protein
MTPSFHAATRARWIVLAALSTSVAGCAVIDVAGSAVGAAISVTGAVVSTGVKVTGKVVEKTIDAVSPSPPASAPGQ